MPADFATKNRTFRIDAAHDGYKTIGVIGAGVMGRQIAALHLAHGFNVVVCDTVAEQLNVARGEIAHDLEQFRTKVERPAASGSLNLVSTLAELNGCDLIIESIVENARVKRKVYEELQSTLESTATVVTNTSSLGIADLAEAFDAPGRFCGFHFCHPIARRPFVEIAPGPHTAQSHRQRLMRHADALELAYLRVPDTPGFVVNRLLMQYLMAAVDMLDRGFDFEAIDAAVVRFGLDVGPFAAIDTMGIDVTIWAGVQLAARRNEAPSRNETLATLYRAGRLGRKTGAGFYRYDDLNIGPHVDDEIGSLIHQKSGLRSTVDDWLVVGELFAAMYAESLKLQQEYPELTAAAIDRAAVFGLGFPRDVGGPTAWASRAGEGVTRLITERYPELIPPRRRTIVA